MRKLTANCWDILKAEESVILLSMKGYRGSWHEGEKDHELPPRDMSHIPLSVNLPFLRLNLQGLTDMSSTSIKVFCCCCCFKSAVNFTYV